MFKRSVLFALVCSAALLTPLATTATSAPNTPSCSNGQTRIHVLGRVFDSHGHQILDASVVFSDPRTEEAFEHPQIDDIRSVAVIDPIANPRGYFMATLPLSPNCGNVPGHTRLYTVDR